MFRPQKSYLPKLALALAMTFGAGAAVMAPSVAQAGGKPCATKKFHYPEVEKACKDGQDGAKKFMKEVQKGAKKNGKSSDCKDCHKDQKSFELKDNAVDDFKELLATSKK